MEEQQNTQEERYKIAPSYRGGGYNYDNFGAGDSYNEENVLSGLCPFCNESSGFKKVAYKSNRLVPLKCDNCSSYVLYHVKKELYYLFQNLMHYKDYPKTSISIIKRR